MVVVNSDKAEGFLHRIGQRYDANVHKIGHGIESAVKKIGHEAKKAGRGAVHELESGVEQAGKIGSDLEKDLLPSSTSIIEESGIALVGLGIIAYLAIKFL